MSGDPRRLEAEGHDVSAAGEPWGPLSPDDAMIVRGLLETADDHEARHELGTGLLRRAARRLVELATGEDRCPECGGPIPRADDGRPATYCSDACRLRAWRRKRKGDTRGEVIE